MNTQEDKIYFGFFKEFHNPTILFSGNAQAFVAFRDLFKNYSNKVGESVNFKDISTFAKANVDVVLKILPHATGMKKINDELYEWGLSPKECESFAKELSNFASAIDGDGFHQYLDSDTLDDVEVVVSIGEYDPTIFKDLKV